jgi:hypothetical protein
MSDPTVCPECGGELEIEVNLDSVILLSTDWAWVGLWEHRVGDLVPVIDTDLVCDAAFQHGIDVDVRCLADCGFELRVGADGWEHGTRPEPPAAVASPGGPGDGKPGGET